MKTSMSIDIRPFPIPETVTADKYPMNIPNPAPAPLAVPVKTIHIHGGDFTYEMMKNAGWSDKNLRDAGYGAIIPGRELPVQSDRTFILSIKDLEPEHLAALCDEFRRSVFKAAGKNELDRAEPAPSWYADRDKILGIIEFVSAYVSNRGFDPQQDTCLARLVECRKLVKGD
jgi:hypothetical protein